MEIFHKRYIQFSGAVIAFFGPVFSTGTREETKWPAQISLDILSWPIDGNMAYASNDIHFLSALTGGFLFGWGMTLFFLGTFVYKLAPDAVRKSVLYGLLSWFCLDSFGSYISGNASNVYFNIVVLLVLVGPLWRPASLSGDKRQ
ncbi:hypothetical protein LPTSP4_16430 [Leptospira ryugenii]|uniref:Uncharacterized protein n=1 Tax=Leptospira ryugenii TaxID=1917863 RepID=A0A2P2DZR4_9LEPT|nr:hypothetical protein [Leptospira ryugenii]GBF50119.1 hypothetical protein LPTSP4_16430 [Leptospira ryugenii]